MLKKDERWRVFGEWVAETRKQIPLSQAEAATKAGMKRQQWNRIERGTSGTRYDTVIEIARVLTTPPEIALLQAGFSPIEDPERIDNFEGIDLPVLFYRIKKLTPEGKAKFRAILEMVDREIDIIEKETGKGRKKSA